MIHQERIKFKHDDEWIPLADYKASPRFTLQIWLGVIGLALTIVGLLIINAASYDAVSFGSTSSGTGASSGVFLIISGVTAILFALFSPIYILKKSMENDDGTEWKTTDVKINEVQRVDSGYSETRSTGSGIGLGVDTGFGLLVGSGGILSESATETVVIVSWHLYTSIGIIVISEIAYNEWLNAGKPLDIYYSVRSNLV